ncbi:hypothetical protein V8G54_013486 [Vigna mungo]|uniref:Uncharacterized protein n=1 Tax=Vigna mungo TaxID=3915 RepID=A0AAQ3NU63_VIGMU
MGNSIRTVGLLKTFRAGEDEPFHIQLRRKVSIDLSERQFKGKRSGKWSEKWIMAYTVDLSTCTLTLTRSGKDEDATGLLIQLFSVVSDKNRNLSEYGYDLYVQTVTDSDSLIHTCPSYVINGTSSSAGIRFGRQIHDGGRVTWTDFFLFGAGDIGGLTVLEKKTKMEEKRPYEVTLAYYFATSAGINDFSGNTIDVGLSVLLKIRVSNGNLDITVEGPDQHPASGLRYLFDEAMRTQIWKPTLCPHCANIQKQRSTMISQSDSDDSNSVPVTWRPGSSKKKVTMNNSGLFNGNENGKYEKRVINKYTVVGGQFHAPPSK